MVFNQAGLLKKPRQIFKRKEINMTYWMHRFTHALAALATGLAAALVCSAGPAMAQTWPQKPIKIIVPYTPGGASDITARILADRMSVKFGQAVTVDNRAGASGTIGTDAVAKAAPDGYPGVCGQLACSQQGAICQFAL